MQSKRDLGFIEGDLIECLNAGDGSWWMGRLRRDKRMVGLFPSNFVQVLDDSFKPASRASSPMPERSPSPNPFNPKPPKETKSKPFRKPFQAYAAPDAAAQKRAELQKQESLLKSRLPSPNLTVTRNHVARAPSVEHINSYGSRAPSPAPSFGYQPHASGTSPTPYNHAAIGSSPPPPPPPHRHVQSHQPLAVTYDNRSLGFHTPRAMSPCPPSPGATGLTPSPLRNAMDDVMSSLQDMGMSRDTESPEGALDPWSPEAFDQTYTKTARRQGTLRPNTAIGIIDSENVYDSYAEEGSYSRNEYSSYATDQQPPQLSNYVERMESRLGRVGRRSPRPSEDTTLSRPSSIDIRPAVPPKMYMSGQRPGSSMTDATQPQIEQRLRHRKSAFEVGKQMLGRTFTTRSSATNSSSGVRSDTTMASSSTQATDRSSATSAGSLARKKDALQGRARSAMGARQDNFLDYQGDFDCSRPQTPLTGITFHSSHASQPPRTQFQASWHGNTPDSEIFGGLTAPKPKKSGFFKKIIESAKTGAASARSSIAAGESSRPSSVMSKRMPDGVTSIAGGLGNSYLPDAASHMGLGGSGVDWVQVRRDVNRSNSLSRIERVERKERCQMMDYTTISPVEELYLTTEGDEGADGMPVAEPTNFQTVNLSLVDKNARFINSLPPMTNPMSLATGYVCRPYRNDVQRLRAIFTWVSEKIAWEGDFEGDIDSKRVIQAKRGCAEEVAVLVMDMCAAVGIHCEVVRGYLKSPGEVTEIGIMPRPNHWWNAVLVDGEWRMMDCSLASPTNPRRSQYSSTGPQIAESWWFLARPVEICWTHIPDHHAHQHICPPVAHEVLLSLPCACPPFFKSMLHMVDYDTSLLRIEDLELVHIKFTVPEDVECVAEVEARAYSRDADGDLFESGEIIKKRALAQAEWIGGQKRYTVKALLPGDEGQGVLKVYAGRRGLMHSIKDIPHPLAFALPIIHTGDNPSYDFLTRHPTPHAQRHDLYVAQPQCQRLAINNTFVFAIRQHPSSLASSSPQQPERAPSPNPFNRPNSAMSITNSSASGSNPSTSNAYSSKKPAKLAIQAPGGKILRLMRKEERSGNGPGMGEVSDGGTWETIIKCGERGVWRGLVLADRSARWCVFAEWTCV
jgi:transglutaminase/protease-like cytokinesis protein 3